MKDKNIKAFRLGHGPEQPYFLSFEISQKKGSPSHAEATHEGLKCGHSKESLQGYEYRIHRGRMTHTHLETRRERSSWCH